MATQQVSEPSFGGFLADLVASGIYSASDAQSILAAEDQFWRQFGASVPVNYTGYVGCTVSGQIVFADSIPLILAALTAANPAGKYGYFQHVQSPYKVEAQWDVPNANEGATVSFTIRGDTFLARGATLAWQVDWTDSGGSPVQTDHGSATLPANGVFSDSLTVPSGTSGGTGSLSVTLIDDVSSTDLPIN